MIGGNFEDILKAQIILNNKENMIYTFILISLLGFFSGAVKDFLNYITKVGKDYISSRSQWARDVIVPASLENELYFERNYEKHDTWDKSDAVLYKLLKIPTSQSILIIGKLEIIKNKKNIELTPDIKFQLLQMFTKEDQIVSLSFRIFSEKLNVCELRNFVEDITEEYLINKKNNLGNKLYYFDHLVGSTGGILTFSKHVFQSTRALDNVFHEKQDELKTRVEFFLNNKEWYYKKGIPHTLGLLLHGPPGTGKTSSIKAIANISKRHIININLSHIKTKKQLKKLFYDERIKIIENTDNPGLHDAVDYIIPIDKRVYVIEDIDAVESELVLKREYKKEKDEEKEKENVYMDRANQEKADLDLSTILNIFDGTLETPGRILIISTNFPEKLDEALLRPGRIDLILEFKLCNRDIIKKMIDSFYDINLDASKLNEIQDYKWSPAEVSQILFRHFYPNGWDKAIEDMKLEKVGARGAETILLPVEEEPISPREEDIKAAKELQDIGKEMDTIEEKIKKLDAALGGEDSVREKEINLEPFIDFKQNHEPKINEFNKKMDFLEEIKESHDKEINVSQKDIDTYANTGYNSLLPVQDPYENGLLINDDKIKFSHSNFLERIASGDIFNQGEPDNTDIFHKY